MLVQSEENLTELSRFIKLQQQETCRKNPKADLDSRGLSVVKDA